MDVNFTFNCERCNKTSPFLQQLSCGHKLCALCISRIIFFNYLNELACQNLITITCKCKAGSLGLTMENIHDMLAVDCNSCAETHSKDYPLLQTAEEQIAFGKCIHHQAAFKELYCGDCQEEICKTCTLQGELHSNHNYQQMKFYAEKLRAHIQTETYGDMSSPLKRIEQIASDLRATFDTTIAKLSQLILFFEESKVLYTNKMNEYLHRTDMLFGIIKKLYSNFFEDLKKSKTTFDINLLRDLKDIKYDFINFNLGFQEDSYEKVENVEESMNSFDSYIKSMNKPVHISWSRHHPSITLTGHSSYVLSLIQLQDGKIASGSYDTTIKIWEVKEKEYKSTLTLTGHSSSVASLLQLKDGRLASGSWDSTIRIWILSQKDFTNTLILPVNSYVYSLLQLTDGRLASGSDDSMIRIWEITDAEIKNTLTLSGHSSTVFSVIQLNDGRIASGSFDKTIKIWEAKSNDFINTLTLTGHTSSIDSLLQLRDGRIVSGSGDFTIKLWEVNDKEFMNTLTLTGHTSYVYSLLQLEDGRLASGSDDMTVRIWELKDNEFTNSETITGHSATVLALRQLNDGRIASGSGDQTIRIWEKV